MTGSSLRLGPGNKRQNNEQPNEQKNKRNTRLHKKAAETAENISGMKRNQNI